MAGGNLRVPDFTGDLRDPGLMRRVEIGVQTRDRDSPDPLVIGRLQAGAGALFVQWKDNAPFCVKPFLQFVDDLVKQVWSPNMQVEKPGPGLITDAQEIPKALGDQQQHALTLAFQQGVRRNGGAHLHRADRLVWERPGHTHQIADALNRRIVIALGVFGEQFMGMHLTIRIQRDDIGECPAAVDPEFPRCTHDCLPPAVGPRLAVGRQLSTRGGIEIR